MACRRSSVLASPRLWRSAILSRVAVVLDKICVIDGYVVNALVEICNGITARSHHIGNQPVRPGDGSGRIINKARLIRAPLCHEAFTFRPFKRPDLQPRYALLACREFFLDALAAALF